MTERNPLDPNALTVDDVRPGLAFTVYNKKNERLYGGEFCSYIEDGRVKWRALWNGSPISTSVGDMGLARYAQGGHWNSVYALRSS